jgi:hypothetical protein
VVTSFALIEGSPFLASELPESFFNPVPRVRVNLFGKQLQEDFNSIAGTGSPDCGGNPAPRSGITHR